MEVKNRCYGGGSYTTKQNIVA